VRDEHKGTAKFEKGFPPKISRVGMSRSLVGFVEKEHVGGLEA